MRKSWKKILSVMLAAMLLMLTVGCGGTETKEEKNTQTQAPAATKSAEPAKDPYADPIYITIEMVDGGLMKAELYPNLAPLTVENFVKLVKAKFYNGLIFHRVIPGFMIQGGGFDENMKQKKADSIPGEFTDNGFKNELKHTRGVLSMARTMIPDSASSQFFIMHADSPHLDGQYAAFGKITEGLEVVDAIANTETGSVEVDGQQYSDVPVVPQVIKTITIDN